MLENGLQERDKLPLRHLTRPHRELAMSDCATSRNMTRDRDVVRRVDENHLRESSPEQLFKRFGSSGVAAQQTMPAQNPQVARPAHRRRRFIDWWKLVEGVLRGAGFADQ